jgi:hypothetical protein
MRKHGGFDYWLHKLATLRIARARGNPAPHKPFLLLVVLEMAERGGEDYGLLLLRTLGILGVKVSSDSDR